MGSTVTYFTVTVTYVFISLVERSLSVCVSCALGDSMKLTKINK